MHQPPDAPGWSGKDQIVFETNALLLANEEQLIWNW